jgi:hypothetical protein
MTPVDILAKNERSVSMNWLFGLTVGGYATLAVAFYCFGGGDWIFSYWEPGYYPPPGRLVEAAMTAKFFG